MLTGEMTLDEALQNARVGEDLVAVLATGPTAPDPSELLSSKRAAQLFLELAERFDAVVVDSTPVLPVTDATVLAAWMDATLLVARAGVTMRRDLRLSVEALRQAGAPLVGMVLNQVEWVSTYAYGHASGDPRRRGRRSRRSRRSELRRPE